MKPYRVLIVDDDKEVLELMVKSLGADYEIHTARDGVEALNFLEKNDYDVMISDMTMPQVDGITLCRKYHTALPIVLISNCPDSFSMRKVEDICHCVLTKDEIASSLVRAIDRACERFAFVQADAKMLYA